MKGIESREEQTMNNGAEHENCHDAQTDAHGSGEVKLVDLAGYWPNGFATYNNILAEYDYDPRVAASLNPNRSRMRS